MEFIPFKLILLTLTKYIKVDALILQLRKPNLGEIKKHKQY